MSSSKRKTVRAVIYVDINTACDDRITRKTILKQLSEYINQLKNLNGGRLEISEVVKVLDLKDYPFNHTIGGFEKYSEEYKFSH